MKNSERPISARRRPDDRKYPEVQHDKGDLASDFSGSGQAEQEDRGEKDTVIHRGLHCK